MKKFLALLLAAIMALSLVACGETTPATDEPATGEEPTADAGEITIAFIGNTTGDYAMYGVPVRNSVMMYFDKLNAQGGINGKKINVLEYDDKGDGIEAVNAFNLACEKGITAIVGSVLTGATIALSDATYEVGMPQVTASATAAGVTMIDPDDENSEIRTNVFRSCFIDPFQGVKMADYAVNKLGAKTCCIFYQSGSDYSEGLMDAFVEKAQELNLEILATEAFAEGDKDFKAQMTNIAAKNPDIVYMPFYYGEAGLAVKALRAAGSQAKVLGGDGFGSIKDYATAEELEGTLYCSGYAPGTEDVAQFEADYKATYGEDVPNMFAPLAWDACMILQYGLEKAEEAGLTPATEEYKTAIIEAIKGMQDVKGITGTYTFDEYNNPIKSAAIIELTGGEELFKEMY